MPIMDRLKPLKEWLRLRETRDLDLESPEALRLHRQLILDKPFLKRLYERYYSIFRREMSGCGARGALVELGSGSGFLKEFWPEVTTSDIRPSPFVDSVFSAYQMPHADGSVRGILGLNTFHHLDHCELFLKEAQRVLAPDGRLVLVEPTHGAWANVVWKHLSQEPFDPDAADWAFTSRGPLSSSNQALAWNVFVRDRRRFSSLFPDLEVSALRYHTAVAYLLSGGLSYPSLLPGFLFGAVWSLDNAAVACSRELATMMTVVARRR